MTVENDGPQPGSGTLSESGAIAHETINRMDHDQLLRNLLIKMTQREEKEILLLNKIEEQQKLINELQEKILRMEESRYQYERENPTPSETYSQNLARFQSLEGRNSVSIPGPPPCPLARPLAPGARAPP